MTISGAQLRRRPVVAARQASLSRPYRIAARVGLVTRGILYLILGALAFDVAVHGSSPAPTDAEGALQELARRSGGNALLVAVAVGLGAYAGWRLLEAASPSGPDGRSGLLERLGRLGIAVVYGGLCAQAVEILSGASQGGSSSSSVDNPQPWAARVLRWPAGPELLGLVGAALVVAGGALALWGVFHDHNKELHLDRLSARARRAVRLLGGVGNTARGFLLALVGVYLLDAAVVSDAAKAKSLDAALQSLARQAYGAVIIGIAAAGLVCFGLYSLCEARLRRL